MKSEIEIELNEEVVAMCKIVARVHQGRYDLERELLTLRTNGLQKGRLYLVDAVNQRLKRNHPKIYRRLIVIYWLN